MNLGVRTEGEWRLANKAAAVGGMQGRCRRNKEPRRVAQRRDEGGRLLLDVVQSFRQQTEGEGCRYGKGSLLTRS